MNPLARWAALAFAASSVAACATTGDTESSGRPERQFVSATELAERLHLDRSAMDETGKLVLTAPADGGEILIFGDTTIVTVNGTTLTTSVPVDLRGGEAWLARDDAAAVETLWNSATAIDPTPWTPPVLRPLDLPRPPGGPSPAPGSRGPYSDQATAAEVRAWSVPLRRAWRFVVIHHSASASGSAAQFDAFHRNVRKWDGLGYDFVIGNGNGSGDGVIEVGYRWTEQKAGAHAGPSNPRNEDGVGICLVGDFTKSRPTAAQMRALSRLCNFLTGYCGIPRENYLLHGDVRQTTCPGPYFPRDFISSARRLAATSEREDGLAKKK